MDEAEGPDGVSDEEADVVGVLEAMDEEGRALCDIVHRLLLLEEKDG